MRQPCRNLIGRDTLLEFLATLQRATVLVSPDSGPGAHGDDRRHARSSGCTPPPTRSAAARTTAVNGAWTATSVRRPRFLNRSARSLPWTEKIEMPGVMDLIEVDDAIEKLDELMAAGAPRTPTRLRRGREPASAGAPGRLRDNAAPPAHRRSIDEAPA